MKKIVMILILLLSGCTETVVPVKEPVTVEPIKVVIDLPVEELEEPIRNEEAVAVHIDDRFLIKLYVSKSIYYTYEPLIVYMTLEYTGEEESIVVWSTSPYWSMNISDDDTVILIGVQLLKSVPYTFIKGITYTHTLKDAFEISVIEDYSKIQVSYTSTVVEGETVQNGPKSYRVHLKTGDYEILVGVYLDTYRVHLKYDIEVRE